MDKKYFLALYDYNYWAHRQVWDCVMQLSEEQFEYPLAYSIGSIKEQVTHTAGVEYWWFHFLCENKLIFLGDGLSNRGQIRAAWDETEEYVRAYLDTLTSSELERQVKPPFWTEDESPVAVWEALIQVANHSTDHRSQTLAGLFQLGAPTVAQDFLDYIDHVRPLQPR